MPDVNPPCFYYTFSPSDTKNCPNGGPASHQQIWCAACQSVETHCGTSCMMCGRMGR